MSQRSSKSENSLVPVEVVRKAESDAATLTKMASQVAVTSVEEEETAYCGLQQIKKAIRTIEVKRKEITQPLNKSLKMVNAMFKTLCTPFKAADDILRGKILAFREVEAEKAEKERERREKIQAAHEAKGHETHKLAEIEPVVAAETVIVKRWVWEVLDTKKVSREYLAIDTIAINKAVAQGTREISGLRIYQKEGLRV